MAADVQGRLFEYEEWTNAIYTKIVQKVGSRTYWEDWARDVAAIAARHETRITAILATQPTAAAAFDEFLAELHATLNDSISRDDAVSMVSQHLITRPIFEALFGDDAFGEANPVSLAMSGIVAVLDEHQLQTETEQLDDFYASIRRRVEGIHPDDGEARQQIIKDLYGRFFKIAFPKVADSLGIVYTPIEVVDFIIRATEAALAEHFDGASLSDEGVHVLDPFTGTGTFMTRLLQSGFIRPDDLERKFADELHANEILLLAYYIAAVNIEATYRQERARLDRCRPRLRAVPRHRADRHLPARRGRDGSGQWDVFPINNERATKQKALDIRVIFGNPPYSAGQESANDNNANLKYPKLDASIAATYAKRSTATLKNSLYDSLRAGDPLGLGPAARLAAGRCRGLRDQRRLHRLEHRRRPAPDARRRVPPPLRVQPARQPANCRRGVAQGGRQDLRRRQPGHRGDHAARQAARRRARVRCHHPLPRHRRLPHPRGEARHPGGGPAGRRRRHRRHSVTSSWTTIYPERTRRLDQPALRVVRVAPRQRLRGEGPRSSLCVTNGLKTNRDAWNYNSSRAALDSNVSRMIEHYNESGRCVRRRPSASERHTEESSRTARSRSLISTRRSSAGTGPTSRTWREGTLFGRGDRLPMAATYRPFHRRWVEAGRRLNNTVYQLPRVYPDCDVGQPAIAVSTVGARSGVLGVHRLETCPTFTSGSTTHRASRGTSTTSAPTARTTAPELFDGSALIDRRAAHNVTDHALGAYRALDPAIERDDIFFYVYGILHSPDYRDGVRRGPEEVAASHPAGVLGRRTSGRSRRPVETSPTLHTEYESVEPWPELTYTTPPASTPNTRTRTGCSR